MVDNLNHRPDYEEEEDDRAVRILEEEIADQAAGRRDPEASAQVEWAAQK